LGFTLLPIGIIIFPIAPEFGIPLLLISTRLLGRRFAWARRFNAWVDARWMSLRARLRGGSPGDGPSRWRWIFGALFIIVCWQVIGTIFALVAAAGTGLTLDEFLPAEGYGATPLAPDRAALVLFAVMVSFLPFIAANLIAYRYILKLKLTRLFTQIGRFSVRRSMFGFAVWLALGLVGTLVFEIANPGVVEWSFNPAGALPYVAVALLLIPIQTTAEELLFRGWFLQWSDNGRRRRTTLAVFNGVIFALPHLATPEVAGEDLIRIVGYVAVGVAWAWVTLRDRTLELAIGAHAANNLSAALLVGYVGSAIPSVSLWTMGRIPVTQEILLGVIGAVAFVWITGRIGKTAHNTRT
ncbi:MAG: type II CAAX prenyl endopeptidase Rce1 family protein, partial [Candidatus Limnocylindrus sp.]